MEEYTQLTLDDWLAMKESLKRDLIGVAGELRTDRLYASKDRGAEIIQK